MPFYPGDVIISTIKFRERDTGDLIDPTNWEVLCKVLDGTAFNQHFWVYAAAATDTEWELTIVDTNTGLERKYRHPGGTPSPAFTDIEAFPA